MADRAPYVAKQVRFSTRDWHTVNEIMDRGDFNFSDLVREALFLVRHIQEAQAAGMNAFVAHNDEGTKERCIPTKVFTKPAPPKASNGGSRNEYPVAIQKVIDQEVEKRLSDVEGNAMDKVRAKVELEVRRALRDEHDTIKRAENIRKQLKGQPKTRIIGENNADSISPREAASDSGDE